jgi:indolepyruvate ferredoxin oxidoreductase, alpha subunit
MAERSFKKEVEQLRLGAGAEFRGEGILAITKALLECGVGYVGGYQGAPISHLMDVLADARPVLDELGVHFESSANEAAAAALLAASVHYPIRGAATWKSTVGTNVASDALANLASGGVTGGALIIVGEDYGEGSSIMQERSHAFAMKSQIWLLDPRPNLPSIVAAVRHGFELSEASNTPVMLEVRIRACHVHGSFIANDNVRPPMTVVDALENPTRDTNRIVLPPASYIHEQEKVNQRWPAALEFIESRGLNEVFTGDLEQLGIVLQGGMYNGVLRALSQLGLADLYGNSRIPLYVMNVTYPLSSKELVAFCVDKSAVLMVEEGQPDYLEQALHAILRRHDVQTPLHGKDVLPKAGEYTASAMEAGLRKFMVARAPEIELAVDASIVAVKLAKKELPKLNVTVPQRPPGFCTGCPERPIFAAIKLVQQELGEFHIAGDIGCHLFSIMPPFNIGSTTMGYGLGVASVSGMNVKAKRRSIAVMGDGGFWHNGLTSGIGNAVYNKSDDVILLVDNFYSAATGGQDLLSSRATPKHRSTHHPLEDAVRGVGVSWVRRLDHTYSVGRMRDILTEALTTPIAGPKVVIASSECMLNRQRRERPIVRKALQQQLRVVTQKFGVDEDVCCGDHACMRLSGCPSLSLKNVDDILHDDPVAHVEPSCVACGNCGEVAEAAVLCPSFYRADVVNNPRPWEQWLNGVRDRAIRMLQRRRRRRWLGADSQALRA